MACSQCQCDKPALIIVCVAQMQHQAFRATVHRQPATHVISGSSVELDAKHWRETKAGVIDTVERFPPEKRTSYNHRWDSDQAVNL